MILGVVGSYFIPTSLTAAAASSRAGRARVDADLELNAVADADLAGPAPG
jgi:hypothetical protein